MCTSQCTPPEAPDENFDCGKKFHIVILGVNLCVRLVLLIEQICLHHVTKSFHNTAEKRLRNHCLPCNVTYIM